VSTDGLNFHKIGTNRRLQDLSKQHRFMRSYNDGAMKRSLVAGDRARHHKISKRFGIMRHQNVARDALKVFPPPSEPPHEHQPFQQVVLSSNESELMQKDTMETVLGTLHEALANGSHVAIIRQPNVEKQDEVVLNNGTEADFAIQDTALEEVNAQEVPLPMVEQSQKSAIPPLGVVPATAPAAAPAVAPAALPTSSVTGVTSSASAPAGPAPNIVPMAVTTGSNPNLDFVAVLCLAILALCLGVVAMREVVLSRESSRAAQETTHEARRVSRVESRRSMRTPDCSTAMLDERSK
jgi:hypothetical protein